MYNLMTLDLCTHLGIIATNEAINTSTTSNGFPWSRSTDGPQLPMVQLRVFSNS